MHFCQDELFALMAVLPWVTATLGWLRGRYSRKTAPSFPRESGSPYRVASKPCECSSHRIERKPLIPRGFKRVRDFAGPVWPFW